MAWTLKDIPTFYLVNGERVDYTEDERKALLTEWKADDTRIENEKINYLRKQRDSLLSESDWTQSRDVTLSNDADWKTYRQALRDITKTYKTLDDVKWPKEPS